MERQMLRGDLEKLRKSGKLLICDKEVDPKFELGAVLKHFRNKKPILFNNIRGSNVSIIGGLFGDRNIFYHMLGTNHEKRIFKFMHAITNPKGTKLIKDGPIKENIITRNIDISKTFPIPTFHENDSSSFITAGIVIIKDPETGKRYTSIRRLQVNGKDNLSILIASPMFTNQLKELKEKKKDMEVAVILGYDYSFLLASQISSELYGVDKYEVDSALREEPLELVKCHTIDLEVPAHGEIVFEGIIPHNREVEEGPFGELMGYYGKVANHPVIEVKAIMFRNNPIFQVSFPCREEHLSNGLIREVELYTHVRKFAKVKDVNVTIGGGCRFHGIVSIEKKEEGDGKGVILGALGSNKDLKHVIVVDDDIDIFNKDDMEGALATRVQGSRDLVIINGAQGSGLDPSHNMRGITDKIGIDATKPLGENGVKFNKAIIPGYEKIDIEKYFPNLKE
ncbi:MAG: UbiD family decarboxylase [Anaeromicrobium sp.]|jgi:2,5-furandicarboxylate decarboxylase 1|uniref:UbiD family decarboxylase n=1 Tax=Anaeromicrobium sp. TaxID=1929132 RepID=UPI0025E9718B|nr:UbiD family decarboxylase [Anaeromicrobium sp.]MCT4593554.1 UbiD family decarboxylase [Anaeromicrobium sp.]